MKYFVIWPPNGCFLLVSMLVVCLSASLDCLLLRLNVVLWLGTFLKKRRQNTTLGVVLLAGIDFLCGCRAYFPYSFQLGGMRILPIPYLNEKKESDFYGHLSTEWIHRHPLKELELVAKKVAMFFLPHNFINWEINPII